MLNVRQPGRRRRSSVGTRSPHCCPCRTFPVPVDALRVHFELSVTIDHDEMETRAAKRLRESQQTADGPHISGKTDANGKLSDSRDSLVERKVKKRRRRGAKRVPTFDDLSDDTLIKIFSNLEFEDLCSLRL